MRKRDFGGGKATREVTHTVEGPAEKEQTKTMVQDTQA